MYKVKTTEWELNEEEMEKARFILDFHERVQKLAQVGQRIDDEITAFNCFKLGFYYDFAARVGVRLLKPLEMVGGPNDYPSMNLSKDGRKVIGHRVVKEE